MQQELRPRNGDREPVPMIKIAINSEMGAEQAGEISEGQTNGNGQEDEVAKREARSKKEMNTQYAQIQIALDGQLIQFFEDHDNRLPTTNEARTLFKGMQDFLEPVNFFDETVLRKNLNAGGYLETGRKVSMAFDDGTEYGLKATFDLVYAPKGDKGYCYQLWPTTAGDQPSKNAQRLLESR